MGVELIICDGDPGSSYSRKTTRDRMGRVMPSGAISRSK